MKNKKTYSTKSILINVLNSVGFNKKGISFISCVSEKEIKNYLNE